MMTAVIKLATTKQKDSTDENIEHLKGQINFYQ